MKRWQQSRSNMTTAALVHTFLAVGSLNLLTGCVRAPDDSVAVSTTTGSTNLVQPSGFTNSPGNTDDSNASSKVDFDTYVAKKLADRAAGIPPPPSEFPFPNVEGWAAHPRPNYINFYRIDDHYPSYLLSEYDVSESHYEQSAEPQWFKESLKQIRRSGQNKFPPIDWIAVAIRNVAEHKDARSFQQSYKVGAIFRAKDVFDSASDIGKLVADGKMDRHPFLLDLEKPDRFPAQQQRWIIVEQHAATNHTATDSK